MLVAFGADTPRCFGGFELDELIEDHVLSAFELTVELAASA